MGRDCKIRIKIGNGAIQDAISTWGFHLMKSDDTIVAPIRDYHVQEYPESASAEIYPKTTLKPFDYTLTLLCLGSLTTINDTIHSFYNSLFETEPDSDIKTAKVITIYNDYKGVSFSGYIKSSSGDGYYPQLSEYEKGAFIFDLVIFVADPRTLQPL